MEKDNPKSMGLRFLINKKTGQIIYGEAGKDFVDLIFSFLILSIGSVMKHVSASQGPKTVGSVTNLYDSMDELPSVLIDGDKSELLNPKVISSFTPSTLRIDYAEGIQQDKNYYTCANNQTNCYYSNTYINTHSISKRVGEICVCGHAMNRAVQLRQNPPAGSAKTNNQVATEGSSGGGGYVKETVTFVITDDLKVTPSSTIASITLLNRLNINDISQLEERSAQFGRDEALELLFASLISTTPLNDVYSATVSTSSKKNVGSSWINAFQMLFSKDLYGHAGSF